MTDEPYTPTEDDLVRSYIWNGMGSISDEWEAARTEEARRTIDKIKADAIRDHEAKRGVVLVPPTETEVRYVHLPCAHCGWHP